MNPKLTGILIKNEFKQGAKGFFLIWAIVAPVAISFLVSSIFGTLFTEEAKLGILDEGSSQIVANIQSSEALVTKEYENVEDLRAAAENGAVDMGIVIPSGFDASVKGGQITTLDAYIWGESFAKNRAIIPTTIANAVRDFAGQEVPVDITSVPLGDAESVPWADRLLPLIVFMSVFLGGMMLPASSIINEKQKRTLQAVRVTPASTTDILISKGTVGLAIAVLMGVVILVINSAFSNQPLLLVGLLALGAVMAVEIGLLLGIRVKDINTLFATIKLFGLLIYAPAFIYMFPDIPQWIGKIFPTYYVVDPIMEISQRGGSWSDISLNVLILAALNIALAFVVAIMAKKQEQQP